MGRVIMVLFASLFIFSCSSSPGSKVPFKVGGQDKTAISILVSPNITKEELKSLIFEIKAARTAETLSKMIPPTTKGGAFGDYAIVWIFVFSEPEWASRNNLMKFINANTQNPEDKVFSEELVKNIKAEYYYSVSKEYGNIGFNDGTNSNKDYEKLF